MSTTEGARYLYRQTVPQQTTTKHTASPENAMPTMTAAETTYTHVSQQSQIGCYVCQPKSDHEKTYSLVINKRTLENRAKRKTIIAANVILKMPKSNSFTLEFHN